MVALAKRICSASQKRGTTCLTRFWESFGGSAVNCSLEPSSVQGNPTIALQLLPLHSSWIQTIDGTGLARMRLESLWKLIMDISDIGLGQSNSTAQYGYCSLPHDVP